MKFIPFFFIFLLLSPVLYSCNRNRSEKDSLIMEDIFEIDVFRPTDIVRNSIGELLLSLHQNRFDYLGDSICIQIECSTSWNPSRNTNPYSVKINEIDTDWFFLSINEGVDTEISMDWDKLSDEPILRTIKTILDTGTYYLCCINHVDVTPQSILDRYHDFDTNARTDINFKMWLINGKN